METKIVDHIQDVLQELDLTQEKLNASVSKKSQNINSKQDDMLNKAQNSEYATAIARLIYSDAKYESGMLMKDAKELVTENIPYDKHKKYIFLILFVLILSMISILIKRYIF